MRCENLSDGAVCYGISKTGKELLRIGNRQRNYRYISKLVDHMVDAHNGTGFIVSSALKTKNYFKTTVIGSFITIADLNDIKRNNPEFM